MRGSDSGLAHGTSGSPQSTIESGEYESQVKENEESIKSLMIDEELVRELDESGVKFSRKDMLFVARDAAGQIVWLESGNANAGLEHILHGNGITKGHAGDFNSALGLTETEVPGYLYRVVTHGSIVSNKLKPLGGNRMGYTRVYYYAGRYNVVTGIGTNGFIATAYPTRRSDS